ncbi:MULTISPECIES: UbiA family prenyltransferase [unclassified Bradyrhizobium]|uniref:UbiA family prenyltransferase n=1 Tax=unclassified Bradyrhizobium TaxID=2631580 RepID=UPI001CD8075D|nr:MULTISPECIES: UbiA family prenyltransferase [unclassified Bradyrhizobium]MCA1379084.1 UbiA family prenyltransferase [Bradyrhizobium sp. IC4060]MCA1489128.1 UbiA family prenyltransferase [Bradyrhizobium sp. IC4061]
MVLRVESLAPPIKVESWLRGQPLTSFQPGKVYIVQFWATWCLPCMAVMRHLVQLQEKYKHSGLEIIGVAAHERARTPDEAQTKLDAWLTKNVPNPNYRIGLKCTGEMNNLWMASDFSFGIPTSFVVNCDGYIVFIGRPMQLDDVIPKVLDNNWRTSDGAKGANAEFPSDKPLVVDLDGSLILTDVLYESFLDVLPLGFRANFVAVRALANGKAAVKHHLAQASELDYATLPYNPRVLDLIQTAKARGRKVYLATAANAKHAKAIADYLGIFDGWFASDEKTNLSGDLKAEILTTAFGKNGFDYVGNGPADFPAWEIADIAYGVRLSNPVKSRLVALKGDYVTLDDGNPGRRAWFKALRVHQYVKNLLVFVPLATSHQFTLAGIITAVIAFVAFCGGASAVYILNDLLDLRSDRAHATKRARPFASGLLHPRTGLLMVPVFLLFSLMLATTISLDFVCVLAGYFVLTSAYSVYLKRKMLVDVIVLTVLYTTRIVAGGVAAQIQISQWLFIFSMFIFTSLALTKRYVELARRLDRGLPDRSDRDYRIGDLDVVAALVAAAGMNAVTIFALYVTSPDVQRLYRHPKALWLICPILIYWIGRALMMAHRRLMDDDPIVFALRDRNSTIAVVLMIAVVIIAV